VSFTAEQTFREMKNIFEVVGGQPLQRKHSTQLNNAQAAFCYLITISRLNILI